ncbi:MAG: oligosaccharide flippase family protein [Methylococcales bacterium]
MTKKLTNSTQTLNHDEGEPDLKALKKTATQGAYWTVANYGLSQALRFGSNLILTRLLFPDLFGLISLVNVILLGLCLFSDIGIGTSIIRSKRGNDPDFLNSAWTIQVIRGFGIWIIAAVLAYPASMLYQNPQLIWLIPVIAISIIISGFNSTALYTSYRNLALKRLVIQELITQLMSLTIMITWAWISPSIWALVAGVLSGALISMIWSHFLIPGQLNRFHWDKTAAQELIHFGKWIFISTILTFLAGQADRVILAKIFSLEMLGVYSIALTLSDVPRQIVSGLSGKIIYPTLSRLAHMPRLEFRKQLLNSRKKILIILALALAVLVSFGDILILLLYDKRYEQASWMLPLLAIGIWPNMLSQTSEQALFAIGKPNYAAFGNFFRFLFTVISIPLGFKYYGILGAIIIVAMNDVPFYFAITFGVYREGLSSISQDIKTTLMFLGILVILIYMRWLLGFGVPIPELNLDFTGN